MATYAKKWIEENLIHKPAGQTPLTQKEWAKLREAIKRQLEIKRLLRARLEYLTGQAASVKFEMGSETPARKIRFKLAYKQMPAKYKSLMLRASVIDRPYVNVPVNRRLSNLAHYNGEPVNPERYKELYFQDEYKVPMIMRDADELVKLTHNGYYIDELREEVMIPMIAGVRMTTAYGENKFGRMSRIRWFKAYRTTDGRGGMVDLSTHYGSAETAARCADQWCAMLADEWLEADQAEQARAAAEGNAETVGELQDELKELQRRIDWLNAKIAELS